MEYRTQDEKETVALASKIAAEVQPGTVIALDGDMGSGKTVFARGFALGLGIADRIQSPTFTILQVYDSGRLPLYHFDVYRLAPQDQNLMRAQDINNSPDAVEALMDIGYEEYFNGDGVCLVEWAGLVEELLPQDVIRITIKRDTTHEEQRIIEIAE